jgi:nicotinate dehydrogenase subunit A
MTITLNVNGKSHQVDAEADTPLLYVLRNDLDLHAAKYGCGLGQCGACTVMIDGKAALSCVTPLLVAQGREITTVEGLGTAENPGPIQKAFIEKQSAQCGYCIAGMMMSGAALLKSNPKPSDDDIRAALRTNLCRCGTHMRIMAAIKRASELMEQAALPAAESNRSAG